MYSDIIYCVYVYIMMIKDFNYTKTLLDLMHEIEHECKTSQLTGEQKEDKVLEIFKAIVINEFGEDSWLLLFEPLVPELIDFIVSISRKDIKLQLNKVKRCCFG